MLTKDGLKVNEYGMAHATFHVEGFTPLLMHNPKDLLVEEEEGPKVKAPRRTPAEQAALGRYLDVESNTLYLPSSNLRASLIEGGTNRQFGPRKPATKILGASVFTIDGEERCPLVNSRTGKPIAGDEYELDVRRVVLPRGTAVLCGRAKIIDWSCEVGFEYDPDIIKAFQIEEVFKISGRIVGVCDYRPRSPKGKGGPFGRYRVELISAD